MNKQIKRNAAILILLTLTITSIIYAKTVFNPDASTSSVQVLRELPTAIEPHNPVPEVRQWTDGNRSYLYFNWGMQPNSGYRLELVGLVGKQLRVRAVTPSATEFSAQVISYPYLLLSLPVGKYTYQVVNGANRVIADPFKPPYQPLRLQVYLPSATGPVERTVLRDPKLNTAGKTTVQLSLNALLSQPEFLEFAEAVWIESIEHNAAAKKWLISVSPGYNQVEAAERPQFTAAIARTVLTAAGTPWEKVEFQVVAPSR